MILRVKVKKQLDGKANGIIESCQEIISELCSIQEWGDFTWRVSDREELVGGYSLGKIVIQNHEIVKYIIR